MKSAIVTDLDSRGNHRSHTPSSVAHMTAQRPVWREIVQDILAALTVSSAIILLAYLYWAA